MKRIESVKLSGLQGERVDVVTFARWKKQIAGIEFSFALHLLPSFKVGLPNKLWISEIGTGFNTLVVVKHPVSGQHMTDVMADKLGQSYVVRLAKSALHNQLKVCGDSAFVDGLVRAEILLAKSQRQRELGTEPKCEACEDTGVQGALLADGELVAVGCQVCLDSKVVATTETDHDGNNVEARCPECVEKKGGLKSVTAHIEMPVAEIAAAKAAGKCGECFACYGGYHEQCKGKDFDWGSPTEEEWVESLTPAGKLDHLQRTLAERQEYSKQLSARATKADYDRIDDIDHECRELEAKIKALTEADLRHQRDQLQLRIDQHGTMTGDTTEQEYETLTEELAEIDKQIHDLENPPCSK